jgi:hypothetical protein
VESYALKLSGDESPDIILSHTERRVVLAVAQSQDALDLHAGYAVKLELIGQPECVLGPCLICVLDCVLLFPLAAAARIIFMPAPHPPQ